MNKIACLFVSDDVFIINIWDDYKLIGDTSIADIISTCIKFNKNTYNVNLQNYKGVIITRNNETFKPEYIIVDIFLKNSNINNVSHITKGVSQITKGVSQILLNSEDCTTNDDNIYQGSCNGSNNEYFISFLTALLKDFIYTNITESKKIDYYHSLFNGIEFKYSINSETKIDLDILIHNYFHVINEDVCKENLEFNIYLDLSI